MSTLVTNPTPPSPHLPAAQRGASQGMLLGLLGVVIFSLTLPMTRIVVQSFDPVLNGLGRALAASVPAAALLWWRGVRRPSWREARGLAIVALGVIVAFPVGSALAMKTLPASHGAVLTGLQPLFVALYATWLAHERPTRRFWAFALLGTALTVAYALRAGGGALQTGDLAMLCAVAFGALGYAEGGRLARQLGGWQVICWALVLAAPFLVLPVGWLAWHHRGFVSARTWFAFGYVALFSQFLGFFAWYAGLARGGIARVGQVQLLQVFFTLGLSALLFGEHVKPIAWLFATAVIVVVALGRRVGSVNSAGSKSNRS